MPAGEFTFALERFTSFGDLLKFLRRRAGLTQRELSIAVGYSHAQISRLELDQRQPDLATITARFIPALDLEGESEVAARLLELAAGAPRRENPLPGPVPYKGLRFFEEADAGLFFGREALASELAERLRALLSASPAPRFLAIVGASGSGKSSLVQAGLIPLLRKSQPFSRGQILCLAPTSRPLQALAAGLCPPETPLSAVAALIDDLGSDRRTLHLAAARLSDARSTAGDARPQPLLLVIDPFEEVFTLTADETERRAFINNLMTAAGEIGGTVTVLLALRADFYARCAPYPLLRDALASQQAYIGPLDAAALRRAIEEPARLGGWELEAGLVDILLQDVGADGARQPEPGFLPLLSHALLETWQRRSGRRLTVSCYLSTGGVRGAIADTADAVYHDELDERQRAAARSLFLHLVQIGEGEGGVDTRRQMTFEEFARFPGEATLAQEVLNRLADARLIVVDHGAVELAHEALIREWPTLRSWLDGDREGLLIHRHLTLAAAGWERRDRDAGDLYRGARLAQAASWAGEHSADLSGLEQEFLAASAGFAAQEEAGRQAQRRHELEIAQALAETQRSAAASLRRRAVYLSIAFVLALLMTGVALFQGELARRSAVTAQNERRLANGRELAAASVSNLEIDPERSILLALQAVSTTRAVDGTVLPEAEEALHRSILFSQVRQTLTGHADRVLSAAFSPDGTRLASIESDGTTILWQAANGKELLRLPGVTVPGDAIGTQRIAYGPDGNRLVTGDSSLVKVWDAASGKLVMELSGHTGDVWAVAFSPDGKLLASGGVDASVRIWDAATGAVRHVLTGHQAAIECLAFRPGGQQLVTAGDDQTLKVWDTLTGELAAERSDFTAEIYGAAYSSDGQFLAAGNQEGLRVWEADSVQGPAVLTIPEDVANVAFSPDGTRLAGITGSLLKLWDAHTGQELLKLAGHNGWVSGLAFSPDGKSLATSSLDRTVKIWSLAPGLEDITLAGQGTRAVYSPDGTRIATAGPGGSVQIWDAATGEASLTLAGHTALVMGVAFRADGKRLASGSFDQTVKVWDLTTGQLLFTLSGHQAAVRDVAYSPDGKWIATASFDESARLWDAETGREVLSLTGHAGLVLGVAFSPDGARLATSSTDGTAKIWDTAAGRLIATLEGHQAAIPDIAFSPNGLWLATGSGDGTVKVRDAQTGKELLVLSGHTSEIQSVAFSADSRLVASGSGDNTAKVWDAQTGAELHTLPGSQGGVTSVSFDPLSGSRLVVGSTDGTVRVFLLEIEDLIALAQTRVTRWLLPWECLKFLHQQACPATAFSP